MKNKFNLLLFIMLPLTGGLLFSSFQKSQDDIFSKNFKFYFNSHHVKLMDCVLNLYKAVDRKSFNVDTTRILLSAARIEYKSIEPFMNYYLPGDAHLINRVIIAEMEEDDELSAYVVPHGFQYIESLLYNDSVSFYRKKIKDEVDFVYSTIGKLNESVSFMDFRDRDVFEAIQMHFVKQFMLGFADFETSLSREKEE